MRNNTEKNMLHECQNNEEKILIEWYRDNPLSVYIGITLIKLLSLGIITENEYKKYLSEVYKKADILKKCSRKDKLGCRKIN
jgi:hypothetical protein